MPLFLCPQGCAHTAPHWQEPEVCTQSRGTDLCATADGAMLQTGVLSPRVPGSGGHCLTPNGPGWPSVPHRRPSDQWPSVTPGIRGSARLGPGGCGAYVLRCDGGRKFKGRTRQSRREQPQLTKALWDPSNSSHLLHQERRVSPELWKRRGGGRTIGARGLNSTLHGLLCLVPALLR